jgi:hypothetical protein
MAAVGATFPVSRRHRQSGADLESAAPEDAETQDEETQAELEASVEAAAVMQTGQSAQTDRRIRWMMMPLESSQENAQSVSSLSASGVAGHGRGHQAGAQAVRESE